LGGTVTDQYYSPDEYAAFSPEKMQQLYDIWNAKDTARGISAVNAAASLGRNSWPQSEITPEILW
jgi:hypothetical protein